MNKIKVSTLLSIAGMITLLSACTSQPAPGADKIGAVVSLLPQAEFVERVGGDKVEVTVMVPSGADPHTYEIKPSQMTRLAHAKLYAKVGSGVEFELAWMDKLTAVNKTMLVVDCSQGITLAETAEEGHSDMDPHIWTSVLNARIMVQHISEGLKQVDPANASYYQKNSDAYLTELAQLHDDISRNLTGVKNRKFIIFHPSLGYLAQDYNLEQIAIEQEGKEPTAAYIARLIAEAKEQTIKVIFVSPQFNRKSAELIAREISGKVITIDTLAKDYLNNMKTIASALKEAME